MSLQTANIGDWISIPKIYLSWCNKLNTEVEPTHYSLLITHFMFRDREA